jgi:hypothetical protein
MQYPRVQVGAVRPNDGAELLVHANLRKKGRIIERLKDPLKGDLCFHIELSLGAIVETNQQAIGSRLLHRNDVRNISTSTPAEGFS